MMSVVEEKMYIDSDTDVGAVGLPRLMFASSGTNLALIAEVGLRTEEVADQFHPFDPSTRVVRLEPALGDCRLVAEVRCLVNSGGRRTAHPPPSGMTSCAAQ